MQDNMTEKTIQTNVNEQFEKEISLWKLICQKPTLEILQRTVLCYQNDLSEGRSPKLPSILITADERGLGSETIARSIAKSLGMSLKLGFGEAFRFDITLEEFFNEAYETAFYINEADKLNPVMQQTIFRIIKDKMLKLARKYEGVSQYIPFDNRLIIIGTTRERILSASFKHAFDLRLSLVLYDDELLFKILRQRIDFLGWQASDLVLNQIVNYSLGNPSKAVRTILQTAYVVSRSEGKDVIEMEHVNKAISMTREEFELTEL